MKKRILSLIIVSAMLAVFIPAINAEDKTDNEQVMLIVEVKGDAALETDEVVLMGAAEYNETDEASLYMSRIMSVQESVQSNIKRKVNRKADVGFTYTNVLNGFSVTVNKSDIDKIKALPNVKAVHISHKFKYVKPVEENDILKQNNTDSFKFSDGMSMESDLDEPKNTTAPRSTKEKIQRVETTSEPETTNEPAVTSAPSPSPNTETGVSIDTCCEMINLQYMHEHGYKGQGQAIAVIDTELDVNHEMFTSPIEQPKYTKRDIADIIENNKLNVTAYPNQVYHSQKVPFAYNYSRNDADVYSTNWEVTHGTHVCGIAAGKNGILPDSVDGEYVDGPRFSSVAPEAQIIFMGVCDEEGNLSDDTILAAVDDATKMDVAAINMSFGADYAFFDDGIYEKVINTAVDAGIMVSAAAGNSSMSYSPHSHWTPTKMIDVATAGIPASVSSATAVGSVQNKMYWIYESYKNDNDEWEHRLVHEVTRRNGFKISDFTSYGTNISLELKPEITLPGGHIWSAHPDVWSIDPGEPDEEEYGDAYGDESGTSMAAPHMTGAAALLRQYIEENYSGKYENPAKFIENLSMSSAQIMHAYSQNPPLSPRCQGAGLLDLEAAAKTPVILLGDNGKTKISLKDKLTDTFEIEFTAKNFTDTDVTYDTVTLYVTKDSTNGDAMDGSPKIYEYVPGEFNYEASDLPESVTVPANGETTVKFTVHIPDSLEWEWAVKGQVTRHME